ncbi:MAG: hypothetical protein WBC44_18375 [Planctomycetaceae bacterium]
MHLRPSIIRRVGLASAVLVGCVTEPRTSETSRTPAQGEGRVVALVYELHPAGATPFFAAMDAERSRILPAALAIEATEDERCAGQSTESAKSVRLQITPAHDGDVRAIATVSVRERPQAAYELILSATELDLIVGGLRGSRFLDGGSRPGGQAWIEVGYGDKTVGKEWTPEPRIDDLVERTIQNGRRIPLGRRPIVGRAAVISD